MLLYYITDRSGFAWSEPERRVALLHRIADAARAGVDIIQLREKDLDTANLELLAREALRLVRDNSATTKLLINTHTDVALAVGADGVHLPAWSRAVSEVRELWMRQCNIEPLIGVSAHSVADLQQAEAEGASFAVLAPIFEKLATGSKGIGLDILREACGKSGIPVLALGGVTLANARACFNAGAAGLAGIRLFQQGEVGRTANALRARAGEHAPPAN